MSVQEQARRSEVGKVERREVEQGEKLSKVLQYSIEVLNFYIKLWRAAFGAILILTSEGGEKCYFRAELLF
jgi:hypothetical protein